MIRSGEVVEKKDGVVSVVFERPAACGECRGCAEKTCARVDIPADAEVGDTVEVDMPEKSILFASAVFYVIPLALLIAGLLLGLALHAPLSIPFGKDLFAALCGLGLLALGLFIVHQIDRALRRREGFIPRVVRVQSNHTAQKTESIKEA